MAWVSTTIEVGDTVKTNSVISSFAGMFTKGSILKVTGVSDRGYTVEDKHGHRIVEAGWDFTLYSKGAK